MVVGADRSLYCWLETKLNAGLYEQECSLALYRKVTFCRLSIRSISVDRLSTGDVLKAPRISYGP